MADKLAGQRRGLPHHRAVAMPAVRIGRSGHGGASPSVDYLNKCQRVDASLDETHKKPTSQNRIDAPDNGVGPARRITGDRRVGKLTLIANPDRFPKYPNRAGVHLRPKQPLGSGGNSGLLAADQSCCAGPRRCLFRCASRPVSWVPITSRFPVINGRHKARLHYSLFPQAWRRTTEQCFGITGLCAPMRPNSVRPRAVRRQGRNTRGERRGHLARRWRYGASRRPV